MYMICWVDWVDEFDNKSWEVVDGEDAMHEFVSDLCRAGVDIKDICVFSMEDEIDGGCE